MPQPEAHSETSFCKKAEEFDPMSETVDITTTEITLIDDENRDVSEGAYAPGKQLLVEIKKKATQAWGRYALSKIYDFSERKRKAKGNLALAIAERMPQGIKQKVTSIVNYYEQHMDDQLALIHKLTEQNRSLRKQVLYGYQPSYEKQNSIGNTSFGQSSEQLRPSDYKQKQNRILELQQNLLGANQQIAQLNKEITDLYGQVKKYKKRVYELESKSKSPGKRA